MNIPFDPNDLLAILPELVLLGATCAILLIDLFLKPAQRGITHTLSLAALAATSVFVWRGALPAGQGVAVFNGMFLHDGVSVVLKQFILLMSALGMLSLLLPNNIIIILLSNLKVKD